ncbi:MAG: response regulator [Armatimonadota bacterium]|nr:response regulator [Armatimonadota bacterium]
MQNVPQITTASSGKDALAILEEERFDLVLASAHLPDMDTFEFGKEVRARHPDVPTVMLVFDGRWFDRTYGGTDTQGIDWFFAWRGTAGVLLSIIKLVEDWRNVDRDLSLASIGILIVVEDSVEHYSSLLPHLYTTLMERTFSLVPEKITENERQLRTRVRPKVLLARSFRSSSSRGPFGWCTPASTWSARAATSRPSA